MALQLFLFINCFKNNCITHKVNELEHFQKMGQVWILFVNIWPSVQKYGVLIHISKYNSLAWAQSVSSVGPRPHLEVLSINIKTHTPSHWIYS